MEHASREAPTTGVKKLAKSSHKVSQVEIENSDGEMEVTIHTDAGPPPKPWNPPTGLKFPCPLDNHVHEVSKCTEFFNLTPLGRCEKKRKNKDVLLVLETQDCVQGKEVY